MATLGVCGYCERVAERTCRMCGRAICERHTDHDSVCEGCAEGSVVEGSGVNA